MFLELAFSRQDTSKQKLKWASEAISHKIIRNKKLFIIRMKYTPDSLFSEHIAEDGDMTSSIQKKSSKIRTQILSKHCLGPH